MTITPYVHAIRKQTCTSRGMSTLIAASADMVAAAPARRRNYEKIAHSSRCHLFCGKLFPIHIVVE